MTWSSCKRQNCGAVQSQGAGCRRLEQRAAVAFTLVSVAIVVILLITVWAYLF
jgi:hypothetical protein